MWTQYFCNNVIAHHSISGRLASRLHVVILYLLWLCELTKPTLLFTWSKSDWKWLRYDQNKNIIASNAIIGTLADGKLVSYLNTASIPNVSSLSTLEVAEIYLPGLGGWGLTVIIMQVWVQIGLKWILTQLPTGFLTKNYSRGSSVIM